MNRKVFIRTTGRIFFLGGLAAATGYLVAGGKVDATCSKSAACQKCRKYTDCELPLALETRQNEKE
ncbi:MAG: hypothetical protein WCY58_03595 [Mariniphaga sp.]|nr:hypothetical protein [Mariniphaga sp.]MDD4225725.1 hypothetical protein [Mariniphaga sp.]